jgi:hypothetical protein
MYAVGVLPTVTALVCVIRIALGVGGAELWQVIIPTAFAWMLQVFVLALFNRRFKVSLVYALLTPLGLAFLSTRYCLIRACESHSEEASPGKGADSTNALEKCAHPGRGNEEKQNPVVRSRKKRKSVIVVSALSF